MSATTITSAVKQLKSGEKIVVTKTPRDTRPPYSIIGNGKTDKKFTDPAAVVDALKVIGSLSKQQLEIFLYFRDRIVEKQIQASKLSRTDDFPNDVEISTNKSNEEAAHIRTLLRNNSNANKLTAAGVIKKIQTNHYMVNPYLLIPANKFNDTAMRWNDLP